MLEDREEDRAWYWDVVAGMVSGRRVQRVLCYPEYDLPITPESGAAILGLTASQWVTAPTEGNPLIRKFECQDRQGGDSEPFSRTLLDLPVWLGSNQGTFDLVTGQFSCPEAESSAVVPDRAGRAVQLTDWLGNIWALHACRALTAEGLAVLCVNPRRFFNRYEERSVFTNLKRFGLFIDAVFLCQGYWDLDSGFAGVCDLNVVVVRRGQSSRLFVAELDGEIWQEAEHRESQRQENAEVVGNYLAGRSVDVRRGMYVPLSEFQNYEVERAKSEVKAQAALSGFKLKALSEFMKSISLDAGMLLKTLPAEAFAQTRGRKSWPPACGWGLSSPSCLEGDSEFVLFPFRSGLPRPVVPVRFLDRRGSASPSFTFLSPSGEVRRFGQENSSSDLTYAVVGLSPDDPLKGEVIDPSDYIALEIDSSRLTLHFLYRTLNATPWIIVQDQLSKYLPDEVVEDQLKRVRIPYPSYAAQLELVRIEGSVSQLQDDFRGMKDALWIHADAKRRPIEAQRLLDSSNFFSLWLDSLPFPLGSILWTYYANKSDDRAACDTLLLFFEGLAQFLATVLLSPYEANPEAEEATLRDLGRQVYVENLNHASFGTWVQICQFLGGKVREGLEGASRTEGASGARVSQTADSRAQRVLDMYCCPDAEVLYTLCSAELVVQLEHANTLRNERSHGGIETAVTWGDRRAALAKALNKVKTILGFHWERYSLVRVGLGARIAGRRRYTVEQVMGSRTPFRTVQVTTDSEMDSGELYLIGRGAAHGLKLAPYVKLLAPPPGVRDACYFYKGCYSEGIKMSSYHYLEQPWIEQDFGDIRESLSRLRRFSPRCSDKQ